MSIYEYVSESIVLTKNTCLHLSDLKEKPKEDKEKYTGEWYAIFQIV